MSEIHQKLEGVCPAIGTLGDYLRILNQTKIASCTAKRTSVGKGSGDEEVFDEVKLLNHRTGQAEETFDSRSLRGNQSQTGEKFLRKYVPNT